MLGFILNVVLIFCLLLGAGIAAFLVPLEKKTNKLQIDEHKEIQSLTLLETLAQYSPNVPAIVQFIE